MDKGQMTHQQMLERADEQAVAANKLSVDLGGNGLSDDYVLAEAVRIANHVRLAEYWLERAKHKMQYGY
jgi:hypothetical protein